MSFKKISISPAKTIEAEKEYKKWADSPSDDIPKLVLRQALDATFIIDSFESQIKKNEECVRSWDKNKWILYAVSHETALKFRDVLIKLHDKEYPEHLEEIFCSTKKLLKSKFNHNYDYENSSKELKKVTAVAFDFTKAVPSVKDEEWEA